MEVQEKKRFAVIGVRIGLVFLTAFIILIFAAYVVLSQNFQNMLTDYTLKLVQSMVEQGVTTIEYELKISQKETMELADSLLILNQEGEEIVLPPIPAQSDILKMTYISSSGKAVSSGGQQDFSNRPDIIKAFCGETTVYGPYFNEAKEYIICYCVPVFREGEIVGVFSIEKDGYYFCSLIKNIRFVDSGESYIINAEGTDIAVSNQDHIDWVNEQYNAQELLAQHEDPVTRSIMELEKKGLSGESGIGTYHWEGSLCYLVYAPIPSVQWVLLAGLREEELSKMTQSTLYASIAKSSVLNICIAVFLLLTAIIVFWIVSSFQKTAEMNEKLKIIANYDALTGIKNRNSYHAMIDTFSAREGICLACVYIDANGLHEINNHLGHYAGDTMLKAVADVLQNTFPEDNVYRIGGDEFVLFCQNQEKQDISRKIELAHQQLQKQGYEISIGIEWRDKNLDIKTMINIAENAMKMDKQRYYKENGKERQMRILNQKLEQMVLEKQDADAFLSVLAPEFKGVYFVDLGKDSIRHLYIPPYFEQMLLEADNVFSKAMLFYAQRIVAPQYYQKFTNFCDYSYIKKQLDSGTLLEFVYQNRDGVWLKLQILKFKTYTIQCQETLWIFSNIER